MVENNHQFRIFLKNWKESSSPRLPGSFAEFIFSKAPLYLLNHQLLDDKGEEQEQPIVLSPEKKQTVEALEDFVERNFEQKQTSKFKIPGGEVVNINRKVGDETKIIKLDDFVGTNLTLPKVQLKENFDVLFIGLEPKDAKDEEPLLDKMIKATQIPPEKFQVLFISKETSIEEIYSLLSNIKIKVIVALGAWTTNLLLNQKLKLTEVHGQFFDIHVEQGSSHFYSTLMPLFHPDFLNINATMKKAAWIDLQKLMKRVG